MDIHILDEVNSIASHFIAELRDVAIQTDRARFRNNMSRLGAIMAYEFSKTLNFEATSTITPLGKSTSQFITNQLYLVTVLRAGIPFYNGFLEVFDQIDSGFIGAYRTTHESSPEISLDYLASDNLTGRELIIVDPMLATGNSLLRALDSLFESAGKPEKVHIFSVIGSGEGVRNLRKNISLPATLWIGSLDEKLNDKAYIVPGLGDAGDLSYGSKI